MRLYLRLSVGDSCLLSRHDFSCIAVLLKVENVLPSQSGVTPEPRTHTLRKLRLQHSVNVATTHRMLGLKRPFRNIANRLTQKPILEHRRR